MKTTLTLILAALISASPAAAKNGNRNATAAADDEPAPVKRLSFDDEDIQGGFLDPDGVLIQAEPRVKHVSLIEIREGFEDEVVKMVEDQ
jgi:hypothetical protein